MIHNLDTQFGRDNYVKAMSIKNPLQVGNKPKRLVNGKLIDLEYFSVECYFKNPKTGEIGWDIQFPFVWAINIEEAARKIKMMPNFDCFISLEFDKFN